MKYESYNREFTTVIFQQDLLGLGSAWSPGDRNGQIAIGPTVLCELDEVSKRIYVVQISHEWSWERLQFASGGWADGAKNRFFLQSVPKVDLSLYNVHAYN